MDILRRNNVTIKGRGAKPMVLVHGYGCDQNMWRFITPDFEDSHRLVLLDLVGFGGSDLGCYDRPKYRTLDGHARDLIDALDALDLSDVVLVGHSVSAMIGTLAANQRPELFASLVMVAPSPRYIDDEGYVGGFSRADIEALLEFLDANFLGWSNKLAPAIMGLQNAPEVVDELTSSFCRADPAIAKHFGRVTFLSDHREDVKRLKTPTLILQCSNDLVAPLAVGGWLHDAIPDNELVVMRATGHCPHLSAPAETVAAMKAFLERTAMA